MKIDNNFITCTRSSDQISKLNKELFNFHVSTIKVSSNYLTKLSVLWVLFSEKKLFFTDKSSVKICADRKTIVRNLMKFCHKTDDNYQLKVSANQ